LSGQAEATINDYFRAEDVARVFGQQEPHEPGNLVSRGEAFQRRFGYSRFFKVLLLLFGLPPFLLICVFTGPGMMTLTRMPRGPIRPQRFCQW
jgi:hypothetical protein